MLNIILQKLPSHHGEISVPFSGQYDYNNTPMQYAAIFKGCKNKTNR